MALSACWLPPGRGSRRDFRVRMEWILMMLELDSISVKYGSLAALSGVSLNVKEGSLHGVIGPNGAGKSTLMDAITGRAKLAGGSVRFNGRDVTRYSVRHRRR